MEFISDSIKIIINNGLNELYKNLNYKDKNYLANSLLKIIEVIYYQYNLDINDYEYQLQQNNYKDVKWLSTLLLPHLNTDQSELRSFNDLYILKKENIDINKEEPEYIFTNLQYGRCKRNNNLFNKIECEEIKFSYEHLDHNLKLLIETLLINSNKMYVNWINIIPVPKTSINKNQTYLNTQNLLLNQKIDEFDIIKYIKNEDNIKINSDILSSLYINDIYNTIRNYLYEDIKEIKILIFDLVVLPYGIKANAISILNEIFTTQTDGLINELLENALINNDWLTLSDVDKKIFEDIWNRLLDSYLKKINYKVINYTDSSKSYDVSNFSIELLLRGLIINFDKKYADKKQIKESGYIPLNKKYDDFDEEYILNLDLSNMDESLTSIKAEYIYEYFRDILQQFKNTFYSINTLTKQKIQILEAEKYDVTIKNIYNYAKSLCSYEKDGKYIQYNKYWTSLENNEKKIILDRLNNKIQNISSWFNINRYIQNLKNAGYLDEQNRRNIDINQEIYYKVRKNIITIIFDVLISKGVLSKFIPNKSYSDEKLIENKKINELIKEIYFMKNDYNDYYKNAYYYLTDLPYEHSGVLFDVLSKDSWYTMQAMEWVSQIGFCHHYINNRITYITGATGVGKSTHIPKLCLYYLKAIDYKSIGKIICTQPRRTPTEKGANEVSKQLGVPIVELDDKNSPVVDILGNKIKLENYSVQMQHQESKHIKNVQQLILKFVTDGLLVQELRGIIPFFKKMSYNKQTPTIINLYDTIIIDEAHEHNKNMDMLLTLFKLYTYYNPSIRFIILSATLDEDEPTYRRYYRAINDNMKYPFNTWLRDNKIDRINVDRRFHISAPGTGTRFIIDEYYKNNYDIEKLIIELIDTRKGDILVFQPGEADIIKLINKLNNKIPDNWIAIPFYSAMSPDRRNFVEDIDYTLPKLRINKTDDFDKVKSLEEGNKEYTNFILVATNIAEASITIKRLYYVIDIGKRKINYYDYKKRNNKLVESMISETSRVQRKGRVGRVGKGEVYYLYKEEDTKKNKSPYEISINNISTDIYIKIRDNNNEKEFNINRYDKYIGKLYETNKGKYNYKGNEKHNDYLFEEYLPKYYETGFNLEDLVDNMGRFYIVHPEEFNIKRNIYGTIIDISEESKKDIILDKSDNKITSNKMESFIEDFITTQFLEKNIFNYNKTELGINITEMIDKFKLDNMNYAKTLIYSILLNCENDIIMGITILDLLRGDIIRLFDRDTIYDTPIVNNVIEQNEYKNKKSDIEIIIEICKKYIKILTDNYKNIIDLDYRVENINKNDIFDIIKNIDTIKSVYYNFEIDEDRIINRDDMIDEMLDNINKSIKEEPNIYKTIEKYCELNKFNIKIFTKFIKRYLDLKDKIKGLYYPDKRGKSYKNFIEKYKKIYSEKYDIDFINNSDKIKLSFVLSQPYNILYPIIGTDCYLPIYYPVTDNIVCLGKTKIYINNKRKYINTTLINNINIKGICYYDNYNSDRDIITNIIAIDNKYIKLFDNIYNKDRIKKIVTQYKNKIDRFINNIDNSKKYKIPLPKDYTIISKVKDSYNNLINII